MLHRRPSLVAAAILLASLSFVAAACSSDDEPATTKRTTTTTAPGQIAPEDTTTVVTEPPVTGTIPGEERTTSTTAASGSAKAEFLDQVATICATAKTESAALADGVDVNDDTARAALIEALAAKQLEQFTKIRALGFPPDDADLLDTQISVVEGIFQRAVDGASEEELANDPGLAEAQSALTAYGFRCDGP